MILVDTSVWIGHLRARNDRLKSLLFDQQVLCHPFVIGELACEAKGDSHYAEGLTRSAFARTRGSYELFRLAAFIRDWYRLGGRSSSRFNAGHRVRNLEL